MRFATPALALVTLVAVVHAAPAPARPERAKPPAAGAVPPRLVAVRPDRDGKVRLAASVTSVDEAKPAGPAGAFDPTPVTLVWTYTGRFELSRLNDLTATTAVGKALTVADAEKQLAAGGVAAVSADGKPVDPAFLAALADETVVLVSPSLVVAEPATCSARPAR